jgi:hypothetical protein
MFSRVGHCNARKAQSLRLVDIPVLSISSLPFFGAEFVVAFPLSAINPQILLYLSETKRLKTWRALGEGWMDGAGTADNNRSYTPFLTHTLVCTCV